MGKAAILANRNPISPLAKNNRGKDYIPAGYSGITMVEEKLR